MIKPTKPLRLLFYDDTCRTSRYGVGLTHSWITGARFYHATGKFDATMGVRSWAEALRWLATYRAEEPIAEIQYWGHGKWGQLFIDRATIDATVLRPGHEHHRHLEQIRERLVGPEALWWFRTCETFGAERGHDFAQRWTEFFGCDAAGHTYIIGPLQSGLHALSPGKSPRWSAVEGIAEGTPEAPQKALWSVPGAPRTISCLRATLPRWAFDQS